MKILYKHFTVQSNKLFSVHVCVCVCVFVIYIVYSVLFNSTGRT